MKWIVVITLIAGAACSSGRSADIDVRTDLADWPVPDDRCAQFESDGPPRGSDRQSLQAFDGVVAIALVNLESGPDAIPGDRVYQRSTATILEVVGESSLPDDPTRPTPYDFEDTAPGPNPSLSVEAGQSIGLYTLNGDGTVPSEFPVLFGEDSIGGDFYVLLAEIFSRDGARVMGVAGPTGVLTTSFVCAVGVRGFVDRVSQALESDRISAMVEIARYARFGVQNEQGSRIETLLAP